MLRMDELRLSLRDVNGFLLSLFAASMLTVVRDSDSEASGGLREFTGSFPRDQTRILDCVD